MLSDVMTMLATFTSPEHIGTNPQSMLLLFPLLAAIAIIYKATKMRVLFWGKFWKQVGILFLTISIFMVLAGAGIHVIVFLFT